jgi:LCP family protein required for cell wall assembly
MQKSSRESVIGMSEKAKRIWFGIAVTAGAAALLLIGYYVFSVLHFLLGIQEKPSPLGTSQVDMAPPKWDGKERVNILLLGTDTRSLRPNETPRSDMMLVVSMDPPSKTAALISVMRDTYVAIPGHYSGRVNTAMSLGGPELAMQTVGQLLDVPIQYYLNTDFEGFIALVDRLGGIEIDVEKDMYYTDSADNHLYDIDLKKGVQELDGKQALQYVRFRHDATSDFTRTERQRKFIQALASEMQSGSSILNMPSILRSIEPYIKTNLSLMDMTKLAVLGFEFDTSRMAGLQVPPLDLIGETNVGGASMLSVDPAQLQPFVREFLYQSTLPPATVSAEAEEPISTN